MGTTWRSLYFIFISLSLHDTLCHEVTSSRCGNNLAQQTLLSQCNFNTPEQQWTSNPLELSLCEATSSKANLSPSATSGLFPQALLSRTIQSPSSVTLNQAMGIVRPMLKNSPHYNESCASSPSIVATTSQVKTSSNLAPAPVCTVSKPSDIIPQKQYTSSVTGVESLQYNVPGATCPSALVNPVASNSAPSSCLNPLQMLNPLQQSPKYSFQLPKVYSEETTLPTLPNYVQKPNSSPTAGTYSVFTEPPNLKLCSLPPQYYLQNTPSTVVADVDPTNIAPVTSLPRSCLPSDTQKPKVIFLVARNTPTETTMIQNEDKLDINVEDNSSAIIIPEENYSNVEIVNKVDSNNANAIDEPEIALDANSGAVNSQWPVNLIINIPPINVPAPSVTFLPSVPSLPSEPAPVVPPFVPTPMMPIIVNNSKSKLKSLLPIFLISLLRDGVPCRGGCSCNSGSTPICIPYPIPIPTNCPIINTGRAGRRKSRNSKSNDN